MSQKITIKEIAEMANVSPGTVDRVLHNRGNVSPDKRARIEKILDEVDYKPNLLLSSISIKKEYRLAITTPSVARSEYWGLIHKGISRAIKEYETIKVTCKYFYYDQFDLFSCRSVFEDIMNYSPDAVLIGPTFEQETIVLANRLSVLKIPYVFVDSMVEGTHPLAFFSANQYACGYLLAKLIHQITPEDSEFVLCQAMRIGNESANNTILRKIGYMDFFKKKGIEKKVHTLAFSATEIAENRQILDAFLGKYPQIKGATVLSSRGNVIAKALQECGIDEVKLTCLDLTNSNYNSLISGRIDYLICQRPIQQGFMAIETLLKNLIFGSPHEVENYMPLDIITQENLSFYKERE